MHQHVCTNKLLNLMINFNLIKQFIFIYFHEHKNTELNHFSSISEEANFRVLQFYPFKMNLILEVRTMVFKEIWILRLGILLYFAYLLTLLQVTCQTDSKILTSTPTPLKQLQSLGHLLFLVHTINSLS